jgi:uncharacterized protein (DUF58 family)
LKLTSAGADYHLAILLLAAVGIVSGGTMFAALGLALAFSSVVSLSLARLRAPKSLSVRIVSGPLKLLKGEEGRMKLSIPGLDDPWARLWVDSVKVRGPVTTTPAEGAGGEDFVVRPSMAGRFTECEVALRFGDPLGLFYASRMITLHDLSIDSLPISLVSPVRRAFVPPLVVGESPAGLAGKGQEFYGIEVYTERSESRDILWNRAAKEPEKPLLARVREANSPGSVTIAIVRGRTTPESLPGVIDLQCEALGSLGRALVLSGVSVEVIAPDGIVFAARSEDELVEAIMRASTFGGEGSGALGAHNRPGMLMLEGGVQEETLAGDRGTPSVSIGRSVLPLDRRSIAFTGTEDLSGILGLVLSR